jgi:hypothetical protein
LVYEPSSLPFGGIYKGIDAYEKFYPAVRKFYDFSRFELINVYAEADVVFAIIKAGIANLLPLRVTGLRDSEALRHTPSATLLFFEVHTFQFPT